MNREFKNRLRARRREVQTLLKTQRARLREARRRAKRQRPKSRRRRWWLLLLLLLLLLIQCPGEDGPGGKKLPPEPPMKEVVDEKPPVVAPPPIKRRLKKRERPAYEGAAKKPKTWLDDFRLQVAGRSVRLASCFEGVDRPGAVRWVCAVDPTTGRVTDHEIEPVASSVALTTKQKACLTKVLSTPPYKLQDSGSAPTPERVGMVLEF